MKQTNTNRYWAFLALLMGLAFLPYTAKAQTVEDGTEAHPFLIENEQEFWDFHDCMLPGNKFYFYHGTFQTTKPSGSEGVDYKVIPVGCANTHIKLTTDILINTGNVAGCDGVMGETWVEWTPMEVFNGHFDGDFHVISGIYCTKRSVIAHSSTNELGLFTQVNDSASVRNLGITNAYISGGEAIGGIAGWLLNKSQVINCFFEGTLEASQALCGGIVGATIGNANIENCYASGRITSQNNDVGGIVGRSETGATIKKCYSSMIIESNGTLTGGICGHNNGGGDIDNCYYDKQMTPPEKVTNNFGSPLLTVEMTDADWTELGPSFVVQDDYYPYLAGFDWNKVAVQTSVMPLFLNAESVSIFDDISNLTHDFSVGITDGFEWTASSLNNAIAIGDAIPGSHRLEVNLHKQGIVDLIVSNGSYSRTYILYPNIAPFLGSEQNPFCINNLTDLTNFRNGINGAVDFTYQRFPISYSNLSNIHWLQTADIDMSSVPNWTPVGKDQLVHFSGYYDGGHHEIVNLTFTSGSDKALFYYPYGHIKNLGFRDPYMTSIGFSGTLATYMMAGSIDSCYVTGDNAHIAYYNGDYCGALIGKIGNGTSESQMSDTIIISHCYNTCDISGTGGIGGIIGCINAKKATLSYCYNTGNISQSSSITLGVAGIVAWCVYYSGYSCSADIVFCYNTGNITGHGQFVGGIAGLAYSVHKISYCYNTGDVCNIIHQSVGDKNVGGISTIADISYCFNTGKVSSYSVDYSPNVYGIGKNVSCCFNSGGIVNDMFSNNTLGGVGGSSKKSYNIGQISSPQYCHGASYSGADNYFDKNMCTQGIAANSNSKALTTAQMIGTTSAMRTGLGEDDWIYEEGMYPRLRWTDTCEWARDVAIAACTPVLFATTEEDADHVKPGMKLFGCDSNVVWSVDSGAMITDLRPESCLNNAITPTLADAYCGATILSASINGKKVKEVILRRNVELLNDTLTIDSLADLIVFQKGVNSGNPFQYKDKVVPAYAEKTYFKLNADIVLPDSNWTPIGIVLGGHSFKGVFLGANHTISNLHCSDQYAGFFGEVRGRVQDLNLTEVTLTEGFIRGAVCAQLYNGVIQHCSAEGSNIGGSPLNNILRLGGIVGYSYGKDTIRDCTNYMEISSDNKYDQTAGICPEMSNSSSFITHCDNRASVQGGGYVGGICANTTNHGIIMYCSNTAEITGTSTSYAVAGIATDCYYVRYCYNEGTIQMGSGSSSSNRYVGGIMAFNQYCYYCYNAGAIYGSNAMYVGGIIGSGYADYCYNSNMVKGAGTYVGSIAGYTKKCTKCYYDKQMSTVGGIRGEDVSGSAEGLTTEQMLTNGLQGLLTGDCWTFSTLLYPQLSAFAGTDASIASVMPVSLSNGETWNAVTQSFYLHGCDEGDWTILQGGKIALDTAGNHCQTIVTGMGVAVLGAAVNGKIYRTIRLLIQINEDNPLIIKNLTELKNFRDVINSSKGYYQFSNQTYHTSLTPEEEANPSDFLEIVEGGRDLYFKLTSNIDMTEEADVWKPIGDYVSNNNWVFQGNFNGNGNTIKGLNIANKSYQGLFGVVKDGMVRNLTIDSSAIVKGGSNSGLLCGTIEMANIINCQILHSKVNFSGSNSGLICGKNTSGTISKCLVKNDTVIIRASNAGGFVGDNLYGGSLDSCSAENMYIETNSRYTGGFVGLMEQGSVKYSHIRNSVIYATNSDVGGICGYCDGAKGESYIGFCSNENTYIQGSTYTGGIIGHISSGKNTTEYCEVFGGKIKGQNYTGGLVGYGHLYNTMRYCVNKNPVSGTDDVGGMIGSAGRTSINDCENYAPVYGTSNYVGGIVGTVYASSTIQNCVNRGNIEGAGNYVGGIIGWIDDGISAVKNNLNIGSVKGSINVGGISGNQKSEPFSNCCNVGTVQGVSVVGGLIGLQSSNKCSNSYNIGRVEGRYQIGGICGKSSSAQFINCYYDWQMCPVGGINGKDMEGGAESKLTSEMVGTALETDLGTTNWKFSEGMYPRLKQLDTNAASISAALPVFLPTTPDTITSDNVPVGKYYLAGCDSTSWIRYSGSGIAFVACDTLKVTGRNVVQIANVIDGDTLKIVELHLGISEENPLEIISLEQFKKFRDLVNSGQPFYFDDENKIFYADNAGDFIEIKPYGEKMFFKLTTDIDLTLETSNWEPIGNYGTSTSHIFKGHFNGDNHIVKNMTLTGSGNYYALFGCVQGTVKNLKMLNPIVSGNNYCAALVGLNKGSISNCSSVGGSVLCNRYGGGIAGYCESAEITDSYNNTKIKGKDFVGGITSYNTESSSISFCFNVGNISATNTSSYAGGIVGCNRSNVNDCYNVGVVTGVNRVGGVVAFNDYTYPHTPSLTNCYNTGYVSSTAKNPQYVGAVSSSSSSSYYPKNCYYDSQMSGVAGGIGTTNLPIDISGSTAGLFTENMVGDGLNASDKLSEEYWTFTDSLYPRLKSMENYDASIATAQPVFIPGHLHSDAIKLPFTVKTNDTINWSRYGTGSSIDISELDRGKLKIATCGYDTLKVSRNQDFKIVPLFVESIQGSSVVDTACEGYYRWAANGRIYTSSTVVTIAVTIASGCDSIMSLDLTIPPALQINMESKNYTCYEFADAYAEATVTGGFENGYIYTWTNAEGDTVGTSNRIDNPEPGTYYLNVRDFVHPACEKSASVTITKPTELLITEGGHDSQCYNQNDGYIGFSVAGGSLPYTVSWSGGGSGSMPIAQACTDTITGLADGTYTVRVTDNHGCYKELTDIEIADDETLHTITAYGVSKMYDGISVNPKRFILKVGENAPDTIASGGYKVLVNGDTLRATVSADSASVKNVCNFNNVLSYTITNNGVDKSCRYNLSSNNSIVEIYKRDVTITSASDQKEYDNTPLTNHTVTISGSGFATGEDTARCTVTGSQTLAGVSLNTFDYELTPNTDPDNYNITKVEGQLFVGKAETVYVIATSDSKMYDGTALSNAGYTYIGPILAEDTVLATVEGSITNAGTIENVVTSYMAVLKTDHSIDHTDQYGFGESVPGTLTVTKRNVTLSTVSDSKVYDGTSLSRPNVTISGDGFVDGEVTSYSATQSITNVGTVTNTIDIDTTGSYLADNYNLTKNEGTLTVTQRSLTIIGESRSINYDGAEHTLNSFTAPNLLTGHTISGIAYDATGTEVGTYMGEFSNTSNLVIKDAENNEVTDNYQVDYQPGALFIGQSSLPLVVRSNSRDFTYDGQTHTFQDYTVLYNEVSIPATSSLKYILPTGDTLRITPKDKGTGITHVSESGKNSFDITLENIDNYASITLDTGTININKREIELRSKSESVAYSGSTIPTDRSDLSVSREGLGFAPGEDVVCTITGSQTIVGSSPNTFTYVVKGETNPDDYDITQTFGTLTITPVTLTVTAQAASKTYGDELPSFSYSLSGFVNNEDTLHGAPFVGTARPVLSTTAMSTSPAGQYPINVDLADVSFTNYVAVAQEGTLTILRKALTVEANSVSGITYDGDRHTWQETEAPHYHIVEGGLLANDTITSITLSGSRTVAGTSLIEPSNIVVKHIEGTDTTDVTQSYEASYQNGSITIEPVDITIKPYPLVHDFTGSTYNSDSTAAPHYEIVSGALVGKDSIIGMTINGSRASFGKTPFVIDSASIKIVDTREVSSYDEILSSQLRNAGYRITLQTDTLNIKHRETPYQIHLVGKDSSLTYNGQNQLWSGWENTVFERDGFSYRVVGLTSSVEKMNVGTYETSISGTARVLGVNDEDVTAEFEVTSEPGTLTIIPKPMTITAKGVSVIYDFLEHSYADNLFPYSEVSGMCLGHNIVKIKMEGKRTVVGRTPIHIVPDSVVILDLSNDTVTYNYNITLVDSAINITARSEKIPITLTSKSNVIVYDGQNHTLTGFDTLRYMIEASDIQRTKVYFHIDPASVTATTGAVNTIGVYENAISGTPIVRDAQENDVSESFEISVDTGTLTINQRPITVYGRDTTFYYDGEDHGCADMHAPLHRIDSVQLCSGHQLTADVTCNPVSISALDATAQMVVGEVSITDASSTDVKANYLITKVNGVLKIEGFPGVIVITSASAELECNGQPQKKEEYIVSYDGNPITAETGSNGLKFVMPTATHDTLTVTPTFAGITTPSQNADSNNVYTYSLQNDTKYVGTRTIVKGTIRMYDSLKVVVTPTPVTCNGLNDGKADVTITGGKKNAGNYSYKLDGGTATNTAGTVNLTSLANGSHTFYVSDSLSYDKTVTFTITQPDQLTLTLTSDNPVCDDGSVMSYTTGGNGGNTFKLNDDDNDNVGVYNHLAVGTYTVKVTDSKGCSATQSVTLTAVEATPIEGITRGGEITSYAPDTTVNSSGDRTDFPSLTASGDIIAQPVLSNCTAAVTDNKITVSVTVESIGVLPILVFEVSKDAGFSTTVPMYTHKVAPVTEGEQTFNFMNLPTGTYYVRAKLYNCAGGSITAAPATATVTVE